MSIKTKMTAIADRLRAMLGTTDALSLDGMAEALDTQAGHVADGFTAVTEMGGTLPDAELAYALPDAIRTIPTGVTVQKHDGSFTTTSSGTGTVSCGFRPDLIVLYVGMSGGYELVGALPVAERKTTRTLSTMSWGTGEYEFLDVEMSSVSDSGAVLKLSLYAEGTYGEAYARKTLSYRAVKYT